MPLDYKSHSQDKKVKPTLKNIQSINKVYIPLTKRYQKYSKSLKARSSLYPWKWSSAGMWKGEEIFNFFFMIKKQAIYVLVWVKNPRCRSLLGGVLELSQAAGWRSLTLDTGLAFHGAAGSTQPGQRNRSYRTDSGAGGMGPHSWQCILPDTRDYPSGMLFFEKTTTKKVTNCVYILAPCKVFFSFFNTKSSIASTLLINHHSTDELWKCDPAISPCKVFTAAGGNIFLKHFFSLFKCTSLFKIPRKAGVGWTQWAGMYQKQIHTHAHRTPKTCTKCSNQWEEEKKVC